MNKKVIDRSFLYKKMHISVGGSIGSFLFIEFLIVVGCLIIGGLLLVVIKAWRTENAKYVLATIWGILSGLNLIVNVAANVTCNKDYRRMLENKEITVRRRVKTAEHFSYSEQNREDRKTELIIFDGEDKLNKKNWYEINYDDADVPVGVGFYVFQYPNGEYIYGRIPKRSTRSPRESSRRITYLKTHSPPLPKVRAKRPYRLKNPTNRKLKARLKILLKIRLKIRLFVC